MLITMINLVGKGLYLNIFKFKQFSSFSLSGFKNVLVHFKS